MLNNRQNLIPERRGKSKPESTLQISAQGAEETSEFRATEAAGTQAAWCWRKRGW